MDKYEKDLVSVLKKMEDKINNLNQKIIKKEKEQYLVNEELNIMLNQKEKIDKTIKEKNEFLKIKKNKLQENEVIYDKVYNYSKLLNENLINLKNELN